MATFFGEVLPVRSRAVDDDDDEEDMTETSEPVTISWNQEMKSIVASGQKYNCKALIMAIGPAASAFLQAHILHQQHRELGRSYSKNESKIFHVFCIESEPNIVICYTYSSPHPNRVNDIKDQLFSMLSLPTLAGSEVVILCTQPLSSYLSSDDGPGSDDDRGHIKCVRSTHHTSVYHSAPGVNCLAQPNTVTGLPAAVLSECEMHQLCGAIYIVYTPTTSYVDHDTITHFKHLTPHSALKYIYKHNSKANHIIEMIQKRLQKDSQFI